MDESSTTEGSGVEVLMVSPQVDEVKLAMQLNFKAPNNETIQGEYEALLIALKAAKNVGASWVVVHSDSQLVVR